ncbi:SDR family NAD(P)-dependent oxidoreductase [Halosimplex pelagicum]|uniref:SDR family NAD(P)-dependent oxidoreductase n=1 Tax=Halosimplex pelagicum TaxID=869886 RepID=A0A7D5TAQ9_9EURY|nr:SDR family NAD(P)-dependent oxidoreductase [Halosimplex pelagicum]QLH80675.1 SDR family NAD(P)-dependent oxidoreductase [Halosimplex pelagicum]
MTGAVDGDSALGEGHVALVTGSTSGIGAETARNLAATGATVVLHGRDRAAGEELVAELPGEGHAFYAADYTDFDEVRALADAVLADFDRLDCLVNNAGTWQGDRRLVDAPGIDDGVELTFAVNHLATFLLTDRLADRLVATGERRAEQRDGENTDAAADPARVVTVSSDLHRRAALDLAGVRGPDGPSGVEAYGHSKLANVLFTFELARRLPDSVTANCCHPGVSPSTGLSRNGSLVAGLGWKAFGVVGRLTGFTDTAAESAETQTHLAKSPAVTGTTGEYFDDREAVRPAEAATDRDAQRDLWRASVDWLALDEGEVVGAGADDRAPEA